MNYLILQHPGHNRVYYNLADKLALAELKLGSQRFSVLCKNFQIVEIENIRYLSFETDKVLSDRDLHIVSRLSFVFAIFRKDKLDGNICLLPVKKVEYEYIDRKISSLLKYQGKTNELFTKMMVNVALLSSRFNYSGNIQLLDPVAGKGTTLFEAAVYGFDAFGIEIDAKSVHEASIYFKKYIEAERLKHTSTRRQVCGKGKSNAIHTQEFEYAKTKQEFKSGEIKKLGIICGNSQDAFKYFKKEKFHLIVGDLPYGIAHGNAVDKKINSATRNPTELIETCLSGWHKILKKGGVVVVAWNVFVASKQRLSGIFSEYGFEVLAGAVYDEFEHMVDKSIKRDIIVAKKI